MAEADISRGKKPQNQTKHLSAGKSSFTIDLHH